MKNYEVNGKYTDIVLDNDKVVRVETNYLQNMVDMLDIDMDEAVLTYLEDEEYEINDEQEELTQKAKENRITATIHKAEDKTKERKKAERAPKENPTKEGIISELFNCVSALEGVSNCRIENKTKIVTFDLNGESFKIDLIQKRKPKA